jgi:glycosyltransferase involved in cell wall biosynthesis
VYEAHGIAADNAAARPDLLTDAAAASNAKLKRLARRDARVWHRAEGYVTITAGLARELERRYGPRGRRAVVPDGVRAAAADRAVAADHADPTAADRAGEAQGSRPGSEANGPTTFTIGYAGHLYPWKGVDLIIEAVTALQDTRALIIGGHPRERDVQRVRDLAVRLDCSSRVAVTGLLPPFDVQRRLREADVLVLPNPASAISSRFTSPLKLFEYMASARPIVASDLPSIREVLTHERNALLVEAGNPQALTAALRRIKANRGLGERLARQALEDVRQYTWEARAARLEALFRQLVEPAPAGAAGSA